MGTPTNGYGFSYFKDEVQHQVTVSSFYIGKYPVTQKEWFDVTGITIQQQIGMSDFSFSKSYGEGDDYPIYCVNWYDAVEYCNKRSLKDGLTPVYTIKGTNITWNRGANGYRLPTEAEWEYACRAGTTTPFYSGTTVTDAGWYSGNSGGRSHPVGEKQPNSWGLYDMHGNVWEWCWDRLGSYSTRSQTNPIGATSGSSRVYRGGCFNEGLAGSCSSFRGGRSEYPSKRSAANGFRIARNAQ
jgi:formylglycine-generating enzyme required for sulfatase activity